MQDKSVYIIALSELDDRVKVENAERDVGRVSSGAHRRALRSYVIWLHLAYL